MKNFCMNSNKNKSIKECKECLSILDKMLQKDEIKKQDYIIKKLNYFLLSKNYDDAIEFLNNEKFKYSQEKEIRIQEIFLVKYYCSQKIEVYNKTKNDLLLFIDNESLITKDSKLLEFFRGEKVAINSDMISEYYCERSDNKIGSKITSQPGK